MSLCTQNPTSSCSRGQSARSPRLRGVHVVPSSVVSKRLLACTIAQTWFGSSSSAVIAEIPRCPGGWFAGSSQPSLPGCPSSIEYGAQEAPSSLLAQMTGAATPTSTRPWAADTLETLDIRRPSAYTSPSLDCVQVSPRSGLRQIDDPCHSLAAAA